MWAANYLFAFILTLPFQILTFIGYWALFKKAGRKGWEGIIPIYNIYVILKISGRPTWWIILLFIPLIDAVIAVVIFVDFARSYGKLSLKDFIVGFALPFVYLPKWGFDKETQYLGPAASRKFEEQHGNLSNWTVPFVWAATLVVSIFLAVFIRLFFFETYIVPTPAMERTLLIGDEFLVGKLNYGARAPITPVAFPFTNHTIPVINTKAYWDGFHLPYYRFPGFSEVKKGDVLVFNYPMDADSPYFRPVDRREHYIKRCEGTPGDTLKLINAHVYVNDKTSANPPGEQMEYSVETKGLDINRQVYHDLHISFYDESRPSVLSMTAESAETLKGFSNIKSLAPSIQKEGISDPYNPVFPSKYNPDHVKLGAKLPDYKWNVDNFGPIIIPKKGWTVKLDSMTFPLYERCIEVYEKNTVKVQGNDIMINGAKADSYTFKLNYYWMMGDNRHDSEDSRYWGFVPEDHIVGKALFIWMSYDENESFLSKIRWSRLFRGIK